MLAQPQIERQISQGALQGLRLFAMLGRVKKLTFTFLVAGAQVDGKGAVGKAPQFLNVAAKLFGRKQVSCENVQSPRLADGRSHRRGRDARHRGVEHGKGAAEKIQKLLSSINGCH